MLGADAAPALVTSAAALSILRCTFANNTAEGAVRIERGSVHVAESVFESNSAPDGRGGAISVGGGGQLVLRGSIFSRNSARWGGALHVRGNTSSVEMVGCTILHNAADSAGGAIATDDGGNVLMSNRTLLRGNAGPAGASISHRGGLLAYVLPAPLGFWVASTIPCRIYRLPCLPGNSACIPDQQPELPTQVVLNAHTTRAARPLPSRACTYHGHVDALSLHLRHTPFPLTCMYI